MGLLSRSLLVLLGFLTVGLPVLAVVIWKRVPSRQPWATLARFGLVLTAQVAAVLLVSAAVNDYGYFYGSWSDLTAGLGLDGPFSAHPVRVHQVTGAVGASGLGAAGHIGVTTYRSFQPPQQWTHRGRLEAVRITGAASQLSSRAYVYLPPQYFQARYAHHRFPAVLALTGYPGTDQQFLGRLRYEDVLLHDMRRHRAGPMVIVMMSPSPVYPWDTECTDVPAGPQVETFLAQDVPAAVSHRYRVDQSGWGVVGDSTGGYCATKLAMTYPVTYPAAVSLSGYYDAIHDPTTGNLWGGSRELRYLNSPLWRLENLPPPPVSLLLTSSRGEMGQQGLPNMMRFVHLAKPPLQVSTMIAPSGGHNFGTWDPQLPRAVSWLSQHLHAG